MQVFGDLLRRWQMRTLLRIDEIVLLPLRLPPRIVATDERHPTLNSIPPLSEHPVQVPVNRNLPHESSVLVILESENERELPVGMARGVNHLLTMKVAVGIPLSLVSPVLLTLEDLQRPRFLQ